MKHLRFTLRQLAHMGARELGCVIYNTAVRRGAFDLPRAIHMGMIQEDDLVENMFYWGYCRSATLAQWRDGKFWYFCVKYGSRFEDSTCYPNGREFDCFVPIYEIDHTQQEWDAHA